MNSERNGTHAPIPSIAKNWAMQRKITLRFQRSSSESERIIPIARHKAAIEKPSIKPFIPAIPEISKNNINMVQ
jgi:hypothetical protein